MEVDIHNEIGIAATIDLKAILSGEDKESMLASIDGQIINHEYLAGKIVLIDFWFIRCHPCRRELPAFRELSKMYPNKEIIILSICRDGADSIMEYDLDHSADNIHIIADAHPRLINDGRFSFPFKALINTNGQVANTSLGGRKTDKPVEELVTRMSGMIDEMKQSEDLLTSFDE